MDLESEIRYEEQRLREAIRSARQCLDTVETELSLASGGVVPSLGALQFAGIQVDMRCAVVAKLRSMRRETQAAGRE